MVRRRRPGVVRIGRREFYDRGGFRNSRLFRSATRSGSWAHFMML